MAKSKKYNMKNVVFSQIKNKIYNKKTVTFLKNMSLYI